MIILPLVLQLADLGHRILLLLLDARPVLLHRMFMVKLLFNNYPRFAFSLDCMCS